MSTITVAVGVLVLSGALGLIWKLAFRLFKYALLALVLVGMAVGAYWYRLQPPPKPAGIGQHAYLTSTGKYLGVVEGQGDDLRRGAVWIVRLPGDHAKMYPKTNVMLKNKRDLAAEPTPEPTATPKPATPQGTRRKQ